MKNHKSHKKINIPEWLIKLPSGNYTTQDIERKTKQSRVNISLKMKAVGVKYEKKLDPLTARWSNVYYWEGAEFYLRKNLKEIIDE